ncbi:hypothetical protein PHLCEN_2v7955, partial [Hermanssonia centrifuga]
MAMHDGIFPAAAKGKAKEEAQCQLGWWELYPLVDGPKRYGSGRHFPSSRQFLLPSPAPFLNQTLTYEPPTTITVSPNDEFVFAYFPGHDGDGAGCLWKKSSQLDSWTVEEWWSFAKGAGVVTAGWTCANREWVVAESGSPYRLPPRGFNTPPNCPTLLLVTQTHQIHVCFIPPCVPSFKILKVSLLQLGRILEGQPPTEDNLSNTYGGNKICVNAAIGMNYNDSVMLVAMRSHLLPSTGSAHSTYGTGDIGLHLGITEPSPPASNLFSTEWEQWGEESQIELCVLLVRFNGLFSVVTKPLPPLSRPKSRLTDLQFFAVPPDIVPPSPTITRDPRRPVKESGIGEKGSIYLVASFLDFEDHTALPKSEITVYPFSRVSSDLVWVAKLERTRIFDSGTLAFVGPSLQKKRLLAGFLDSTVILPRRGSKAKEVAVGNIVVLSLPDLTNDDKWETSHIVSSVDGIGRDIPVGVAVSPNNALICSITASSNVTSRTTVHSGPRHRHTSPVANPTRSDISRVLVCAICSRNSPSDIIHALVTLTTPIEVVTTTLYGALAILDAHSFGLHDMWKNEIMGIATEVYLGRAEKAVSEIDKELLTERGKTAHDICSVAALNWAFEDCRDGDAYDLEAVWQLVGLSTWLISLLERILKQCVFIGENSAPSSSPNSPMKDGGNIDPLASSGLSILVNLIHPYALNNLNTAIAHVKRFRDDLNSLSAKKENSQMAKDVIMDHIACSGVHLDALSESLQELSKEVQKVP